jgi:hypothetical protein
MGSLGCIFKASINFIPKLCLFNNRQNEMLEELVLDIANAMDEDLPSFNKRGFLKYFCSIYENNIDAGA